jgi:NAD(P)-dependent dehydrogenase (short-subunit alcohol dehydrogenase family)
MADGLFGLDGKVALVTGGSRGIGRAIALRMAEAGARIVVSSRKLEACEAVVGEIARAGGEAHAIACNVSSLDQIEALVKGATARFGRIDILVGNAAVNPHYGPMTTIEEPAYDKIMDSNVKANLWLAKLVLPQMAERKDGVVILVSSIAGLKGTDKIGVYGLSKAADSALARNLAVGWGKAGIRANAIAPGLIRTDFARALWEDPERRAAIEAAYPLGRIGEPDDVAGVAVFLASAAGRYITGQTIVVDGGATIADVV